jgi:hypothetical protein
MSLIDSFTDTNIQHIHYHQHEPQYAPSDPGIPQYPAPVQNDDDPPPIKKDKGIVVFIKCLGCLVGIAGAFVGTWWLLSKVASHGRCPPGYVT